MANEQLLHIRQRSIVIPFLPVRIASISDRLVVINLLFSFIIFVIKLRSSRDE